MRLRGLLLVAGLVALVVGSLAVSAASALPAGWGYELISPADSLGNDVNFGVAGLDGDHAWVSVLTPISRDQSTGNALTFNARRTPTGWVLQDPGTGGSNWHLLAAYSADGTGTIDEVCDGSLLSCLPGRFMYERLTEPALVGEPVVRTTMLDAPRASLSALSPLVVGTSDDLSRLIIHDRPGEPPLLPVDTHAAGTGLYESDNGTLKYLGYDENSNVLPCGAVLGSGEGGNGFEQNGVSADGQTVAFESPDPLSGCPGPVDVYVRRNGVTIDVSRPHDGSIDEGAAFAGASRDGNITYFATTNRLVTADTDTNLDIYSYTRSTGTYERLSAGVGVAAGPPPQIAVSPGGDYVYFKSRASFDGQGVDGAPNLYMFHGGSTRFIATATQGNPLIGGSIRSNQATYITPDGTSLLFMADDPLSSGKPTGGFVQLMQYNATRDIMTCVSCPPDGSVPTAGALLSGLTPVGNVNQHHQSDDGESVAFETNAALLPDDLNGTIRDVYLWRRNQPLALISSGRSEAASIFDGMSADGHSVFFEANDSLVPGLDQTNHKVYVARLGGGFPPGTVTPRCSDEACRSLPMGPPASVSPASTTFSGVGNVELPIVKKVVVRSLTRAQKLSKALRKCKTKRKRSQRKKCESSAKKSFGRAK